MPSLDRLVASAFEYLGEVTVSLTLPQERIGSRPPRDCFLGELHRLGMLAACRVDEACAWRQRACVHTSSGSPIVDRGTLAGAGAHSYSAGDATRGSDEAARFNDR